MSYPLAAIVLMPRETQRRAMLAAVAGLKSVPRLFDTSIFWNWFNRRGP